MSLTPRALDSLQSIVYPVLGLILSDQSKTAVRLQARKPYLCLPDRICSVWPKTIWATRIPLWAISSVAVVLLKLWGENLSIPAWRCLFSSIFVMVWVERYLPDRIGFPHLSKATNKAPGQLPLSWIHSFMASLAPLYS